MFVFYTLITHLYAFVRGAAANGRGSNYELIINWWRKWKVEVTLETLEGLKDTSEHQGELEDF